MRKIIISGLIAFTAGASAFGVYANTADVDTVPVPYESSYRHMGGIPEGDETPEEHFDRMKEYHEENGYRGGHCHSEDGSRMHGHHGRGMMGRNR